MNFDTIFIPKGNGLGWTLNFGNPLSWVLLMVILLVVFVVSYRKIKGGLFLLGTYIREAATKNK